MRQCLEIATKALALCAGAFLFSAPVWAKDEPLVLTQSDKWIANFDTESCQLLTSFGEDDGKVLIRITRYWPSDGFALDLYGKRFNNYDNHSKVKFQFGPDGAVREAQSTNGTNGKLPMLMLAASDFLNREWHKGAVYTPITAEQETAVKWLDVAMAGRKPIRLQLGSMGRPMQVMRTCMADLVKSWGFSISDLLRVRRFAEPLDKPGNWLNSADYPREMLAKGGQGIVRFRLDIDEAGNVSSCHIQQRTNPDAFADLSCKLISKRAKFNPAIGIDGKPVRSIFVSSARWFIGD